MDAQGFVKRLGRGGQRGSAMVELVFVLPALLLMLAIIAEAGVTFVEYNGLTERVRSAARYAAFNADFTPPPTGPLDNVIDTAKALLCGTAAACDAAPYSNVSIGRLPGETGNGKYHVLATATYTHVVTFSWYLPACGSCTILLNASALMRAK